MILFQSETESFGHIQIWEKTNAKVEADARHLRLILLGCIATFPHFGDVRDLPDPKQSCHCQVGERLRCSKTIIRKGMSLTAKLKNIKPYW